MPYKSDAQRRYFNANRAELESQGVDVDEWNESSKGKKLPEKVKKEAADGAPPIQATQMAAPQGGLPTGPALNTFENMRQHWLQNVQRANTQTKADWGGQGADVTGFGGTAAGAVYGRELGKPIGSALSNLRKPHRLTRGSMARGGGRGGLIGGLLMALLGNYLGRKPGQAIGSAIAPQQKIPEFMSSPVTTDTVGDVAKLLATKSSEHNLGLKAASLKSLSTTSRSSMPKEKSSMDAKQASGCGGGMKKKKKKMAQADLKKAATAGLQRYIAHLYKQANNQDAPLHYKQSAEARLVKLSQSLAQTGDLWTSLGKVYPEFDAEKRFKVAESLATGMFRWLRKRAMGNMASAGTGAGMMGGGMKMAPSGSQTMPASAGMKMPM